MQKINVSNNGMHELIFNNQHNMISIDDCLCCHIFILLVTGPSLHWISISGLAWSLYLTLSMLRVLSFMGEKCEKLLKTIQTLLCWYSLESSRRELSDEYPFARVSVIFQVFCIISYLAKSATSSIRVKCAAL